MRSVSPNYHSTRIWLLLLGLACVIRSAANANEAFSTDSVPQHYRSPVDLAVAPSNEWLVTANEESDSVSLIGLANLRKVDELRIGRHPAKVAFTSDGKLILATASWSGDVHLLRIKNEQLHEVANVHVGFEPIGIAIAPDNKTAYVGLNASGEVAEIDLQNRKLVRRFKVGSWPKYMSVSTDGKRLAVGCSGEGKIAVVDTDSGEVSYKEPLANGINLGHMITHGDFTYFTWMVYRTNPINVGNLRRGWLLASRIGRVRLDGPAYREAISLDVPGKAVADPHGIAITPNKKRMVVSASGTHELLVYRLPDAPFVGTGGPGDLIDRRLERDRDRFDRIPVGGRPMGIQLTDNQTVYVANYLRDSVQVVDMKSKRIVDEVRLSSKRLLDHSEHLVRQGMQIFYDGQRSMDQWYSCHSCHQNGGVNSRPMDTWNDGTERTVKMVLPLYDVAKTSPWTWHGWQQNLDEAMHKSITSTMLGKEPSSKDKQSLIAFLNTIERPPNPFRDSKEHSSSIHRGQQIFQGKAGCADCHNGPQFTDGQIHDVGTGSSDDAYDGYNTPSLVGTYQKVRWLHTGRARDLDRVLTDLHSPEKVSGGDKLNEQEVADLIAYLKSL